MRSSVFIAASVDGFIARLDGRLDWLPDDGGEPHGYTEFIATIDGIVIGRKTFETVLSFDAWPYGTTPVIVLTSTPSVLKPPANTNCSIMSGSPPEILDQLAKRGLTHLYVDGGVTIQGFLRHNLIQRLIITRIPVLLGAGIPLFGSLPHDVRLEHVVTRSFKSGLVQSEYIVAG
jgi:dihydrofolate reductase